MIKTIANRFLQTCFAMAVLLPLAAAASRAEPVDQLYEKAKVEKTLVFYSGGPAAPHENRAKEFMQKYPGIAVSVTGGFSNVLNERSRKARRLPPICRSTRLASRPTSTMRM